MHRYSTRIAAMLLLSLVPATGWGQEVEPPPISRPTLPETVVEAESSEPVSPQFDYVVPDRAFGAGAPIGRGQDLIGQTPSASEGRFGQEQLDFRPLNRAGDVLELIPGVIATQHSGTGKANQYFVRGINLDHGTDFALRVDGVPMNLPSHGHGQGYLDVNWLIPELVEAGDYKLGPYYADVGDFSSAGSLDIRLRSTLPNGIATATAGAFDYYRVLVADSQQMGDGQLLYAYESIFYDGPWDLAEDFNKFNGLLRWSTGDEFDGFAITAQGYRSYWNATNQIPQRAVDAGLIGRFGTLDPTDAGDTSRVGLNAQYWRDDCFATTRANAYVSYYDLDLFSNFTFFLDDPVNGDQIEQIDRRVYEGLNLSRQYHAELAE
ncbi:MAG: TonB-dependent receptor plug domain-containing protein, partial [Betaproteobacteria bacterium]